MAKKSKPKLIKDIDELRELADTSLGVECFILLGGLRSSKSIRYSAKSKKYKILNHIDGSFQSLTEEKMLDPGQTNIGIALNKKALYQHG